MHVVDTVQTEFDDIETPIKIDLRRFLPLSNIKYIPAFAGKLELKIMFGIQGLAYCHVGPLRELMNKIDEYMQFELDKITAEFPPIVKK